MLQRVFSLDADGCEEGRSMAPLVTEALSLGRCGPTLCRYKIVPESIEWGPGTLHIVGFQLAFYILVGRSGYW